MAIITTRVTDEQLNKLKEAADTLTEGNISEMTRRLLLAGLDDYQVIKQSGFLRIIKAWRHFTTWRHRRSYQLR